MSALATCFESFTSTRSSEPLSDDAIRRVAPSIFAEAAHSSRSHRYTYVPTGQVLAGLRHEGFEPFMACQARVRDESRRAFTKHMLRLRHRSQIDGAEANEIVLVNSHDGTSCWQMLAGVFRFVCQNGMVCGDIVDDIRIPHRGRVVDGVIEGAYTVLKDFERVDASKDGMKATVLSEDEQRVFAESALTARYGGVDTAPIAPERLLRPKRAADADVNVWSVFNRIQEHLVRGGVPATGRDGRARRSRGVNGIDSNVRLNQALWVLAEGMRKLKGGK